jgi:hypothetical protein
VGRPVSCHQRSCPAATLGQRLRGRAPVGGCQVAAQLGSCHRPAPACTAPWAKPQALKRVCRIHVMG